MLLASNASSTQLFAGALVGTSVEAVMTAAASRGESGKESFQVHVEVIRNNDGLIVYEPSLNWSRYLNVRKCSRACIVKLLQ